MNLRVVAAVVIAIGYLAWRAAPQLPVVPPSPAPAVVSPFAEVQAATAKLSKVDRDGLRDAYTALSKAVAADPPDDPVFVDTAAVRRAHRAALLVVWRGVLGNQPGEAPGLREALEGAVDQRIGVADIPLNPTLRDETAKAFADVAASIQ